MDKNPELDARLMQPYWPNDDCRAFFMTRRKTWEWDAVTMGGARVQVTYYYDSGDLRMAIATAPGPFGFHRIYSGPRP